MKNKLPRKYKITCRVRPLDAPENLVFPRYVDRHYDDAGYAKTAETLVLSGFSGGGGGPYLSPVRLSTLSTQKQSLSTTQVKTCELDYKGTKSTLTNRFIVKQ